MGFEPTRAEPIGLAVQRLNHSATSSSHRAWSRFTVQCLYRLLTQTAHHPLFFLPFPASFKQLIFCLFGDLLILRRFIWALDILEITSRKQTWLMYQRLERPSVKESARSTPLTRLPSTKRERSPSLPRDDEGMIVNSVDMVDRPNQFSGKKPRQPRRLSLGWNVLNASSVNSYQSRGVNISKLEERRSEKGR